MAFQIEPRHDISPNEIDAIEDRIYDHNSYATGRHDRQDLGNPQRGGTDDRRRRWLYVVRHFWNLNRCGSMRHIEDAGTRVHY